MTPKHTNASQAKYLSTKVLTASQPELHMMLLDGAMRFGRQSQQTWVHETANAELQGLLDRTINVVEALTQGLADGRCEVSKDLEEQYAFIYRELVASRVNNDRLRLDSAMDMLQYQRDTWRLACDRLADEKQTAATPANDPGPASDGPLSLEA